MLILGVQSLLDCINLRIVDFPNYPNKQETNQNNQDDVPKMFMSFFKTHLQILEKKGVLS